MLNINWSDSTIVGGLIGIVGSIIGAIIGALLTALMTWLSLRGKIKFIPIKSELKFCVGNEFGSSIYRSKKGLGNETPKSSLLKINFLITNSKKEKYSLSNFKLIAINKKNKFKEQYNLKDCNTVHKVCGIYKCENADNYVIDERSNVNLTFQIYAEGVDFYKNYEKSKLYITYINNRGKTKRKRLKINFDDSSELE